MSNQNVSIVIPPEVLAEVLTHVNQARTLLAPYLTALTPEQRKTLPKMADKSVAFVSKALQYAESNPEFAPAYLHVPDLQIDVKAVQDLTTVEQPAEILVSQLSDTIMLSGSEAYVAALMYYNSVKRAADTSIPGAKAIYDDLKVRFEVAKKKEPAANAA